MERLRGEFALYPISQDETATCRAILDQDPTARLLLMPTHHISMAGDMMGFKYECLSGQPGSSLPIVRTMFSGHTATECQDDDAAIMRLMSDPQGNKERMSRFLDRVAADERPPVLECIPDNATVLTSGGVMQGTDLRSVDCKPWAPEAPESIGIYHAYIRGYNRDVRTHRLFIVCTGGCPKASDQFCNLMIDVGHKWTSGEVADSEEAWWLRKACQRARCRLIRMLAEEFGLKVQCVEDVLAHPESEEGRENVLLAVPTTDTIEHDMARRDTRTVMVMNTAVDTTKVINGMLCQMHPSEGYWLFRGAPRGTGVHGAMFGGHEVCGAFPTRSPQLGGKHPNAIAVQDGQCVVRGGKKGGGKYMCFDEAFFKNLERMQWNRDNGYVELIPVVVGIPG
jgi:hypothetical protein